MQTITVNLNFDDFHPQRDHSGDFGGDPEAGAFLTMRELLDDFPGLVITNFTPTNWIDRPYTLPHPYYKAKSILGIKPVVPAHKNDPFRLDKHPEWARVVQEEVQKGRFEIACHGHFHYNPNQTVHGQEFSDTSYAQSLEKICQSEATFAAAGISYIKAFRPPGWGVSAGLVQALREKKYSIYAPHSSRMRVTQPGLFEGMITIPQTWSIADSPELALVQAKNLGYVFMKGHVAYQYGREIIDDGICAQTIDNLRTALTKLEKQYAVNYTSLSDYATRQKLLLS